MEIVCDECGSEDVVKAGYSYRVVKRNPIVRKRIQQYRCKKCFKIFVSKNTEEGDNDGTRPRRQNE